MTVKAEIFINSPWGGGHYRKTFRRVPHGDKYEINRTIRKRVAKDKKVKEDDVDVRNVEIINY